eukprot:gene26505-32522_t
MTPSPKNTSGDISEEPFPIVPSCLSTAADAELPYAATDGDTCSPTSPLATESIVSTPGISNDQTDGEIQSEDQPTEVCGEDAVLGTTPPNPAVQEIPCYTPVRSWWTDPNQLTCVAQHESCVGEADIGDEEVTNVQDVAPEPPPVRVQKNKSHATQDIIPLDVYKKNMAEKVAAARAEAQENKKRQEEAEENKKRLDAEIERESSHDFDDVGGATRTGSAQEDAGVPLDMAHREFGAPITMPYAGSSLQPKESSTEGAGNTAAPQEMTAPSAVSPAAKAVFGGDEDKLLQNYAASSNGAKTISANPEGKHASAILSENPDTYYISPCAANRWTVVELSEEAMVTTVVLANYEFYSSSTACEKQVGATSVLTGLEGLRVVVDTSWVWLGKFEADNVRTPQKFVMPQPAWVRYIRLQMDTHHGAEHFCTLSLLRVHGVDVVESFKHEMELM